MPPKVSTIIPAFNSERTIARTLDSALAQTYRSHEIIVVNDGSTDSTMAILSRYRRRVQIVERPNGGAAVARNVGVARADGTYLAFLDSDDIWMPDKLGKMVSALEGNPAAHLAFSDYYSVDECGAVCAESQFSQANMDVLLSKFPLPVHSFPSGIVTSSWLVRRDTFIRAGGFDQSFGAQGFEDSWLLVLLRDVGDFEYVPEPLAYYRVPGSGESADKYGHALATFIALTRQRYGPRGRDLIRTAKNLQCRWLLSKSAHQMDRGEHFGAIRSIGSIGALCPVYFLSPEFVGRLILPQNLRRVLALTGKATRSQRSASAKDDRSNTI